MVDEIQVDYAQLQQVALQFSQQATAVNQMQQLVKRSMGQLQGAWVGQGSHAFFTEMNDKVLPAANRLYHALQDASKITRQIAQVIEQAERDAAAPFQTGVEAVVRANAAGGNDSVQDAATRWAGLSNAERERALQSIANDIARQYGLKPIPVSVTQIADPPGQDALGEWDGSTIRIDVDNLGDPGIVSTLAHEARHAIQQSLAEKAVPGLWDSILRRVGLQDAPQWPQYGITEETARAWSVNLDSYRNPPAAFNPNNPDSVRQMNDYLTQPVEVDASQYGKEYVENMTGARLDTLFPGSKANPAPRPVPTPRPTQAPSLD